MKTRILLFVLMFTGVISYAQQDAQFTQYMYNTINVNPAYAGSRGALSIFALHRTQWVGLDGAPVTNAVSINTRLFYWFYHHQMYNSVYNNRFL